MRKTLRTEYTIIMIIIRPRNTFYPVYYTGTVFLYRLLKRVRFAVLVRLNYSSQRRWVDIIARPSEEKRAEAAAH